MAKVKANKKQNVSPQIDKIVQAEIDRNDRNPGGEEKYGARASAAKVCAFCKHEYLNPCTIKTKDKCPNYIHLQSKGKNK